MRNCLFFKLIAILLCAASLMGIIGGAAGALVLVNYDLYNKTVDEVIAQQVESDASSFANQIAYRYADQILGGCPKELARSYGSNRLAHEYTTYGYAILDGEGNVLTSLNPELKDSTKTYSIPITGQYMHLVSLQTESQAKEEAAQKRLEAFEGMTDLDGDTVPPEGISINQVIFSGQDGYVLYEASCDDYTGSSTYYYRDYLLDNGVVDSFANTYQEHTGSRTGFLFSNSDGQLTYSSFLEEHESTFQVTVYGVLFHNGHQNFTFQTDNPEGIGTLSNESGYLVFTSFAQPQEAVIDESLPAATEVAPEETVPETLTEETAVPEETQPETTEAVIEEEADSQADAETYVEETQVNDAENSEAEGEPSSASAIPEEGGEEIPEEAAPEAQEDSAAAEEAPPAQEEPPVQETEAPSLAEQAEKRIYLEWMLAQGLISENDLPQQMISDGELQEWLVQNGLITPEQTFPAAAQEVASAKEPLLINGKPLENYQVNQTEYYSSAAEEYTTAKYVYLPMPELTVEVYVNAESLQNAALYEVLEVLRQFRGTLLPIIGICLLVFVLSAVYLVTAAGRSPRTHEIRAEGINRLPLDLYLVLGIGIAMGMMALASVGVPILLRSDFLMGCSLAAVATFICCLLFIGFCFAFTAQVKNGSGLWWRNTLTLRFIFLFMHCAEAFSLWIGQKGYPAFRCFMKRFWQLLGKGLRWLHEGTDQLLSRMGKSLDRFFSLIPMTWQWLLAGLAILLFTLLVNTHHILLILLGILVPLAIILYATHCFGMLFEGTKRMSKGNLNSKVEDRLMMGCFRDFAGDLNDLADVAAVAAQKQLKSERMKTELITNVSHDIKTPLTSIINYVDLLQKPHSEEEGEQYLEVLDRQSQRLKKLVEDLMDMSKASTGNMTVEITQVDAVESVNQALGEFADKLDRAQLYPVFRHADISLPIMADGKLVWRVLSNLLSNAVKYAMPRTRIYLDLTRMNGKVILSLKNISREPLNVDAEELMERFVRGDVSRNTDGSGLGLNIAKSLMELQQGQLQILVDGDLFKVTLIFPEAE